MTQNEPISNDDFIEWTKEIFNSNNCPGPRMILVFSVETAQMLVDAGVPVEYIDVIKPLKNDTKRQKDH